MFWPPRPTNNNQRRTCLQQQCCAGLETAKNTGREQAVLDKIKQNILPFPGSACYNGIRK